MSRKEGTAAGGDAPAKEVKIGKKGGEPPPEPEEPPKSPSQIAFELAEERALMRKQRFKRRWPEVTKVEIKTRKWRPPPHPKRIPRLFIEMPEVRTRKWVAPYKRRRRARPRLQRIPPEAMTQPLYECAKLKKTWHGFSQVTRNKMMLQGTTGCNSKRYSQALCGAQTAAVAIMCKALLEEKTTAQLTSRDIDDVIEQGDKYYRQAKLSLKCYKGKPSLDLNQMPTAFFFHDTRYTVKLSETERGLLLKHPDNVQQEQDLLQMMDRRIGQTYAHIISIGGEKHFLVWGHPPSGDSGSQVKTVCYLFDPHTLNEDGQPSNLLYCCGNRVMRYGGAAILRYAGVNSFVTDFLANYGDLESAKLGKSKQFIVITDVDIVQREPLLRYPDYELDLKALRIHCRSEWESMNINALIEKKHQGKYPLASLSKISLATSRSSTKKRIGQFYQKSTPKEAIPQLPVPPEKGPAGPTQDQIMQLRGEDFFLYCPKQDGHTYGRDDMVPQPKSETIFHSPVEIADVNFHSQYKQLDVGRWILRGTRHFACQRYDAYKYNTALSCCVAALGMLRRLRARAWNEDTVNECLDVGSNIFRESLIDRRGPMRALTLGELKDTFNIRNNTYKFKQRGIAVWGKLLSNNNKIFDLCRGLEAFFKESDAGVLQIPGEYETAIWQEGGKFYVFHPWPTDHYGHKIGLREGGKSAVLSYNTIGRLCEHFLENAGSMKKKPFSIADVTVTEMKDVPEPVGNFKSVSSNRWVIRGRFHEGDARFPEEHRNKQATPISIAAIAIAHVHDPSTWTSENVDESLVRGDILYQQTVEHMEAEGITADAIPREEEAEEEETAQKSGMAAAEVLTKFQVSEYDCIETEVMDSLYSGSLNPEADSGMLSLKDGLKSMFNEYSHGVVTARGSTIAVWKHEDSFYLMDPHGCDENGYASDEPRAAACLIRLKGTVDELVNELENNLPPGTDNSFNISPVTVTATKLNYEIGAPEATVESKAFQWIRPGTAAIMLGPRGESSALGKSAEKSGVPKEDLAGRTIALPAAAAFVAAASAVPPPHMHQDHMFNFLDAGADYYLNHVKKSGKTSIEPEDLTEKFEMGTNTFSIELGTPMTYPLRLPDSLGEEAEEEEERELGEGEEEEKEPPIKEMKSAIYAMMSKPNSLALLVGDYHQLGVWCNGGGKVVVFDPAPTLPRGMLTADRIRKGDELRIQRLKDLAREMAGEGGLEEEGGEEMEGESKPEPEPGSVPPDSCPALMVFASPSEFIDKLVTQGPLDHKQHIAPYKLYPVRVTNELTSVLKEKKSKDKKQGDDVEEEEESESLVEAIGDEAMGKYFNRIGRSVASLRGRVAQGENYFMEIQRDNQDAANSIMGIVVDHIEPYIHWKPTLVDAILKYGDRLHTMSVLKNKKEPPLNPTDIVKEFHVTNFNVKLEITADVVIGDIKAGRSGRVLDLQRALQQFFQTAKYGVLCSKHHCVAVWKAADDKSYCVWDPHAVGPSGRASPGGAASIVIFSNLDELADTFKHNIQGLNKSGSNKFCISSVQVWWEVSKIPGPVTALTVPDEGYEFKVLTAYVETSRGRTILRGSRPPDIFRFTRDALLQSSCGAIVGVCMSHIRKPHLWTRRTVDEIMAVGSKLFSASLCHLGYEFRPGEDILLPLQVLKRFILGVNYVRFDIESVYTGKLEQTHPSELGVRAALERFFELHTHGILWSVPHAVGVWRVSTSPSYYMMEPHACGATGLRVDAQDNGAACVLTFSSAKLMAYSYLQNIPLVERSKHDFHLYAMSIVVQPITKLGKIDPPLLYGPSAAKLVPATSKIYLDGRRRRADEQDRKHPPGSTTCLDMQRAVENMDKDANKLQGQRNTSGWLVLTDGSQYLSANHSMECKRFSVASRGYQALACSVMAVAMSRVQEVCKWCTSTLDDILDSGDQLYQDSYLHYRPTDTRLLTAEQILRKFYTPENCVCRVVVYESRHEGNVSTDMLTKLEEFFNEEKSGVFVAEPGQLAVALFRTARGYYMFDPADRDRYGRAVAPPCRGRARACFSQYPSIKMLAEKLAPNIPPVIASSSPKTVKIVDSKTSKLSGTNNTGVAEETGNVRVAGTSAMFVIYGMDVTGLRRINKYEN